MSSPPGELETPSPAVTGAVSLFVPAYNEAATLPVTMPRLLRVAEGLAREVQLVVVDNGSTDATTTVLEDLTRADPRVLGLRIPLRGVGAALRAALPHFRHPRVIAVDADLAMDLYFIEEALRRLDHDAEIVVGAKEAGTQHRPFIRVFVSDFFVFVMRRGLGLPYHDVSIGAKAYRTAVLHRYEALIGRGSNYVLDILLRAHADGLRIEEVAVSCDDTRPSHFNLLHEGFYRFGHLFRLVLRRLLPRATTAPV